MKRIVKRVFSLALVLALMMSVTITASAASSSLVYKGRNNFEFAPGSAYSRTSLFGGFENVMPGDTVQQDITIKNEASDCDFIKVYLQAIPHDEVDNPLTYGEDGQRTETVVTMSDFLSQLSMKVWHGEKLIYEASPDELDGLAEPVLLDDHLARRGTVDLKVELNVPIELGNEYAYRVGEVDWKIIVEAHTNSGGGGGGEGGGEIIIPDDPPPLSPPPSIDEPDEELEELPEEDVPLAELPQTGLLQWPIPLMAIAGIVIFLAGYITNRKERKVVED